MPDPRPSREEVRALVERLRLGIVATPGIVTVGTDWRINEVLAFARTLAHDAAYQQREADLQIIVDYEAWHKDFEGFIQPVVLHLRKRLTSSPLVTDDPRTEER